MRTLIFVIVSICSSSSFAVSENDLRNAAIEANQLCNQRTLYPQDQQRNCNMAKNNYYAIKNALGQAADDQHDAELRKSILKEVQDQKDKDSILGWFKNLWHAQAKEPK